jgi:hypothetical protein
METLNREARFIWKGKDGNTGEAMFKLQDVEELARKHREYFPCPTCYHFSPQY